jgi:uncharacterized membrane protein
LPSTPKPAPPASRTGSLTPSPDSPGRWIVYFHILWFAVWIIFGIEGYPFGLLTMIVSLEAIFLSTFVMISQNRADFKRQAAADLQWKMVQEEDDQNRQLIELSNQILELTKAIHAHAQAQSVKQ